MKRITILLVGATLLSGCGESKPQMSRAELSCAAANQKLRSLVAVVNQAEKTDNRKLLAASLSKASRTVSQAEQEISQVDNPPVRYLRQLRLLASAYQRAAEAVTTESRTALSDSLAQAQQASKRARLEGQKAGMSACGSGPQDHPGHLQSGPRRQPEAYTS